MNAYVGLHQAYPDLLHGAGAWFCLSPELIKTLAGCSSRGVSARGEAGGPC